jgi:N-carbamoylputrescine amidase
VPVAAANRVGEERVADGGSSITFYGSSFVAGPTGQLLVQAGRGAEETVLTAELDLGAAQRQRTGWGVFRDRRPELYGALLTLDGGVVRR